MRHLLAVTLIVAAAMTGFAEPANTSAIQGTAQETKAAPAQVVNINTASPEQLEQLPGVGPKTAARIVEYRQKNGGFKKVEELMNVRGIGEKAFLKMKNQLTVSAPKAAQQ